MAGPGAPRVGPLLPGPWNLLASSMTPAGPPRGVTPSRTPGAWGECPCQAPPPHTLGAPGLLHGRLPASPAQERPVRAGLSGGRAPLPAGTQENSSDGGRVQGGVQRPAPPAPGLSAQDQGRRAGRWGFRHGVPATGSAVGGGPRWRQGGGGRGLPGPAGGSGGGEQGLCSSAALSLAQGRAAAHLPLRPGPWRPPHRRPSPRCWARGWDLSPAQRRGWLRGLVGQTQIARRRAKLRSVC